MTGKPRGYRHRPAPIAAVNAVGRGLERFGIANTLDADAMMAVARRRTGLSDFGDDGFMVPLRVLVESINAEARLTQTGRFVQGQRIAAVLANRLRAEDLLRRHPEIHDLDLGRIVLIAGMQRTGTTLLHRLLASNPEVRSLAGWEALNPVPLAGEGRAGRHRRVRRAKAAEWTLGYLAPTLFAIHPIEHDAPEEDILLIDMCFMSQTFEATMHVPTYSKWLEQQDHSKAYEYLLTLLKVLAWQRSRDVWVLKTPQHLEYLDVVQKILPNVTVVQTHRDPGAALVSFCSMVAHARGMLSDRVAPSEIAAHWSRKMHRAVARAMQIRDSADPLRFVDVCYDDLLRDPMTELRRVYGSAGLEFGPAAAEAAEEAVFNNRQHRFGRHIYDPDDFGLSSGRIDGAFASYRANYGIATEPVPRGGGS